MATNSEVDFPKQKGWYTLPELKYLANSLGFDSSVFTKVILSEKKILGSKCFQEKKLVEVLDMKIFDKYLDSTFNNKPAKDNVKTIKKTLQLLRHKILGFPEITQARIAYFLYENDDQLGMDADKFTILKAFKLCDRVISPVRLSKYLVDMSLSVQIPCRLQLHEFLELASFTTRIDDVVIRCEEDTESDFATIQTRDQKALSILDEEFKAAQAVNETTKEYSLPMEYGIVQNSEHESSVLLAQDQAAELYSSIANSTIRLRSARSGHCVSRPDDQDATSRATTSLGFDDLTKRLSRHQSLKFQFRKLPCRQTRQSYRHSKSTEALVLKENKAKCKPPQHDSTLISQPNCKAASPVESSKDDFGDLSNRLTRSQPSPLGHYSSIRDGKILPIITDEEINEHQHKIDDLQWNMLRKETANSKRRTLKSSASVLHVHSSLQPKVISSKYLDPQVQVLSIFGELETEKLHPHQKPRSLSRSRSVNFKL